MGTHFHYSFSQLHTDNNLTPTIKQFYCPQLNTITFLLRSRSLAKLLNSTQKLSFK